MPRSRTKPNATGRGGRPDRYLTIYHYLMDSPAWKSLPATARAIYLDMARRYAGPGSNNGRIPYSVRDGADELGIGKTTASRALTLLCERGFIVPTKVGGFNVKAGEGRATEWKLTAYPSDSPSEIAATKEFMRWQPSEAALDQHPPGKLLVYP